MRYDRQLRTAFLSGVLFCLTCGVVLPAASLLFWPDKGILGLFRLLLEGVLPYMLLLGLGLSIWFAALGHWRLGGLFAIVAAIGMVLPILSVTQRLQPAPADLAASSALAGQSAQTSHLDVIWINLLFENLQPPSYLARALLNSGADLIVVAEAEPLRDMRDMLAEVYPHQLGCAAKACNLLVLSRVPFEDGAKIQKTSRPETITRFQLVGHTPTIIATHLVKPWYAGFISVDEWYLETYTEAAQAEGRPILVMGDFNTPAWGKLLQTYMQTYDLYWSQWPVATWPVVAAGAGVAIDHMLVGDGARLQNQRAFGVNLGSNHRGLRADLYWSDNG